MPRDASTPTPHKSGGGGGVEDTVECANGCGKSGTKRCSGCKEMYCSPACQREHWTTGGHKAACKAAQTRSAVMIAGQTVNSTETGADGDGACIICLDSEPRPIQSGCACRGDAGLAHVQCRVEAAIHRDQHTFDRWWECGTCGQQFTGVMKLRLAEEWWKKVRDLPQEDNERCNAVENLANTLGAQGKYTEAEPMHREILAQMRLKLGPDHPCTLKSAANLAVTLVGSGKYASAEATLRELLPVMRRVQGPEHPQTLWLTTNLASVLSSQDKYIDAEAIYREVLPAQRRVLGLEHPITLQSTLNLAATLSNQGNHADAEAIQRDMVAVQRRVLGPNHPDTLTSAMNLAIVVAEQGKHNDAEVLFREVAAARQHTLGPEHPDTLLSTENLAIALERQGKHTDAGAMFREVLAVQCRVLGPDHPHTIKTVASLNRVSQSDNEEVLAATSEHVRLTGGCLCGRHRYTIMATPKYVYYCHCSMCRKASGSIVGAWLTVASESFLLDPSEVPLSVFPSSERFERHFCSVCGSHILFCRRGSQPEYVEVCHGSLDAPEECPPQNHIWTSAQLPFVSLDTHLPSWSTEPK